MEREDALVGTLRGEITANDTTIVEAVNARLELVRRLKQHKDEVGLDFVDPEREARLLAVLAASNRGPLSPEGLEELVTALLALTKRELGREG